MKLQLLLTGNELMSGDTVDSNSSMIAKKLAALGISIHRKVTVSDKLQELVAEIDALSKTSDVIIINGGLGPTVDDMTAMALAKASGDKPLVLNEAALQHVQHWCNQRNIKINDANKKQAWLPENSTLIANPVGSAVGINMMLNNCLVLCTPGVPSELLLMIDEQILPLLKRSYQLNDATRVTRILTFGYGEATMQQLISNELGEWPEHIELGFRAGAPLVEVKLTSHSKTNSQDHNLWCDKLLSILGSHVVTQIEGAGEITLAEVVIDLLKQTGKTITTAESCTGGLIASMITEVSGASDVFHAGFVTYSNAIKQILLAVTDAALQADGAVSLTVVEQMAKGALNASKADYVIAVSGIAGPNGGSEEKPVGTVCIAWGSRHHLNSHRLFFPYERKLFQILVSACCLDLIRRQLLEQTDEPHYFKDKRFEEKRFRDKTAP